MGITNTKPSQPQGDGPGRLPPPPTPPLPHRSARAFFQSSENPTCRQSPARLETRPRPAMGRNVRVSHASVAQWQSNGFVNRRSSVQSRPLAPVFLSRRWINPMPAIPDRNLTVYVGQDDRIHRMGPNRPPQASCPSCSSCPKPQPSNPSQASRTSRNRFRCLTNDRRLSPDAGRRPRGFHVDSRLRRLRSRRVRPVFEESPEFSGKGRERAGCIGSDLNRGLFGRDQPDARNLRPEPHGLPRTG